jgi:hypothetical protein
LAVIALGSLLTTWGADVASAQRPGVAPAQKPDVAPAQKPDVTPAQKPDVAPAQDLPKYEVTGFRDAHFGMTEAEVRALAIKSFGIKDSDMTSTTNLAEGTTVLTARVPSLDPGPGPATIAYIFGAKSKKLIQVNVVWGDDEKAPADANAILGVGSRLERYFAGFTWKKDATRTGVPVGDNTVVLFAGEDEKKGAVRLIVDGVKYQAMKDGSPVSSPDPKGPPKLLINYIADRENPDVAKIDPGKF